MWKVLESIESCTLAPSAAWLFAISAVNAASGVIWVVQIVYFFQILSRLA